MIVPSIEVSSLANKIEELTNRLQKEVASKGMDERKAKILDGLKNIVVRTERVEYLVEELVRCNRIK